jgi:parallel beta-helix repeat protein
MNKKQILTTAFIAVLLSSALAGVQFVRLAEANFFPLPEHHSGIYIKSDGSVDPSNSPIQRDGSVYTLTGDISVGIAVERSNVLINGNGYTFQGNGSGTAFYLQTVENVTIQGVAVQGFNYGFYLHHCNWSTIKGNEISGCRTGIEVTQTSCYNRILENTEPTAISIYAHANHIIIAKNDVTTISVTGSDYVTIENNNVATNTNTNSSGSPFGEQNYGIYLDNCNNGKLYNNTIERNRYGIYFWHCVNFTLSGNVLRDNDCGIQFKASSAIENRFHVIDTSNTINGKPVYYLVNQHDIQVPSDAGWVAAINCTNITVQNVSPPPNGNGILFAYTKDSKIINSTLSNNYYAILLDTSSNCTIARNLLCNNGYCAIYFDETVDCTVTENVMMDNYCIFGIRHGSKRNTLFRNNFIDNGWIGAFDSGCQNTWDNGSEGNYWSSYNQRANYAGVDADGDGIGDTPYNIDDYSDNVDRYPLMARVDLPTVIPEFPSWTPILLLLITLTVALSVYKWRRQKAHLLIFGA